MSAKQQAAKAAEAYQSALATHREGSPLAALKAYTRAGVLDPASADIACSHGIALAQLGRIDEALAKLDRAIRLAPGHVPARANRGIVLAQAGRLEEAVAAFDATLAAAPDHRVALLERGIANVRLHRPDAALADLSRILALYPDDAQAWRARADLMQQMGKLDEAVADYDRTLALAPGIPFSYVLRGNALRDLGRLDAAIADYGRALAIDPALPLVRGDRLYAKLLACDWTDLDKEIAALTGDIAQFRLASAPFPLLMVSDDPVLQRQCAERNAPPSAPPIQALPARDRIHVAYVTSDLHAHATMFLFLDALERHDRTAFEITLVSTGPLDAGDPWYTRAAAACDRVIDARFRSDAQVVAELRALGVDLAIDLKGPTRGARLGIFAQRAAPVQAGFLGFPGTSGIGAIDYILADAVVIPEGAEAAFTEKVVRLPGCYQPNGRALLPAATPDREAVGLPADAFVFASFNNSGKILPAMLARWAAILRDVPGSVPWLWISDAAARDRLVAAVQAEGIAPERLIFADTVAPAAHLARLPHADLLLDTFPCGGHTTTSDALRMGVPVLTRPGRAFASRVAASLLTALDLTDLIAGSDEEYHALAVALATDRARYTALRGRVAAAADAPAFDAERTIRGLERAFRAMVERSRVSLPPAALTID